MPTYNFSPTSDGTNTPDTATFMQALFTKAVDPEVENVMVINFDLSSIGVTEIITQVRLRLHTYSYVVTKGQAKTWWLQHFDSNSSTLQTQLTSVTYAAGVGWHVMTVLSVFDKDQYNRLIVRVHEPSPTASRDMRAYTVEYATVGSRPLLEVSTYVPGTGVTKHFIMAG